MSTELQDLVGQVVASLEIDDTSRYLRFTLKNGEQLLYVSEGDCCSVSWFHYIEGVQFLLRAKILKVQAITIEETIKLDYSFVQLYKITMITTQGYVDFEYRNESNGYYGAYIMKCETLPETIHMKFVTTDYRWNG